MDWPLIGTAFGFGVGIIGWNLWLGEREYRRRNPVKPREHPRTESVRFQ